MRELLSKAKQNPVIVNDATAYKRWRVRPNFGEFALDSLSRTNLLWTDDSVDYWTAHLCTPFMSHPNIAAIIERVRAFVWGELQTSTKEQFDERIVAFKPGAKHPDQMRHPIVLPPYIVGE